MGCTFVMVLQCFELQLFVLRFFLGSLTHILSLSRTRTRHVATFFKGLTGVRNGCHIPNSGAAPYQRFGC